MAPCPSILSRGQIIVQPIPIPTSIGQHRKPAGPTAEPTPSPSPVLFPCRSPFLDARSCVGDIDNDSTGLKDKHHFGCPHLIESRVVWTCNKLVHARSTSFNGYEIASGVLPWEHTSLAGRELGENDAPFFLDLTGHDTASMALHDVRSWASGRMSTLALDRLGIESPPPDALWISSEHAISQHPHEHLPEAVPTNVGGSARLGSRLAAASDEMDQPLYDNSQNSPVAETVSRAEKHDSISIPLDPPLPCPARSLDPSDVRVSSPPLLGSDLVFPRCESPEHTRPKRFGHRRNLTSVGQLRTGDRSEKAGLWQGCCQARDQSAAAELVHPVPRRPFLEVRLSPEGPPDVSAAASTSSAPSSYESSRLLPLPVVVPTRANSMPLSSHEAETHEERSYSKRVSPLELLSGSPASVMPSDAVIAEREKRISTEFSNAFITQVYYYLSLDLPVLARTYDEELSKTSGMPIEELSKDDETQAACFAPAHDAARAVRTPNEEDLDCQEQPRWKALKKFIHDWARQQPDLDKVLLHPMSCKWRSSLVV